MNKIGDILNKNNISLEVDTYGDYIGKFKEYKSGTNHGKLILVTAVSPTPYGEGKTTVCIGLLDALKKLSKNAIGVLREPSLGPVFGIKGGATGGGKSQVVPTCEINLNFTGDLHAIGAANNLLSAAIDNHIHFGNELNIDSNRILFKRCVDMNDRALKSVTLGTKEIHDDGFVITAASEVMAIFCLAKDIKDLKNRLNNILIAYDKDGKPVFAKDLNVVGAMAVLLKDAIRPNVVQTLEENPVIIHGGPFANIAHGCNSVIATNLGLSNSDYVVTEAGFGSDLGALKFFDIKCRENNIYPNATVLVCTIKALKYNGNDSLKSGINNLGAHIDIVKNFTNNIIVCINKYDTDSKEDIEYVFNYCKELNIKCVLSSAFVDGSDGAIELANEVLKLCDVLEDKKIIYDINDSIKVKVNKIIKDLYGADDVIYTDKALLDIECLENNNLDKLPICIAKNQYSLSDDKNKLGRPTNYVSTVTKVEVANGAGFIVIYLGNIIKMPGLPKVPNYVNYDLDDLGNIIIK